MPRLNTEEARAKRNARKRTQREARRAAPVTKPHVPAALRRLVTHLDEHGPTQANVLQHVSCLSTPSAFSPIRRMAREMGLIEYRPWAPEYYGHPCVHTITDAGREWLKEPGHRWSDKAKKP